MPEYWIDTETGTWGKAETLMFTDRNPRDEYSPCQPEDAVELAIHHGYSLDEIRDQSFEDGRAEYVCQECNELNEAVTAMRAPIESVMDLGGFDVFGGQVCRCCGLTGIHSRSCLVQELDDALCWL